MTGQPGTEGETPPCLFVHPLHLHFCAVIPAVMGSSSDGSGHHDEVVIRKAMRLARMGYEEVESAIKCQKERSFT